MSAKLVGREPTPEMVVIGKYHFRTDGTQVGRAISIWQDMHDAAPDADAGRVAELERKNALLARRAAEWQRDFCVLADDVTGGSGQSALGTAPKLRSRIAELEQACSKMNYEICQTLGKALGYPYLNHTVCAQCDPEKGCTCGNPQICEGEHVAESIAVEAANRIAELERRSERALAVLDEALGYYCGSASEDIEQAQRILRGEE